MSTDSMRTPEDLVEFSLETSTSSGGGKSFISLNELNRNPRISNENDQVNKTIYIDSQPLSAFKLLQNVDPMKSQKPPNSIKKKRCTNDTWCIPEI